MTTQIKTLIIGVSILLVSSCNIYAPLNSSSSDNDFIEEAMKCLHNGDFACAIENYQQLSSGVLKDQKLCTAYLAKSGFTLNALTNVVTQKDAGMMGALANALVPWDATRGADAATARTQCAAFAANPASGDNGVLLRALAYMNDCATRMAKSDLLVSSDGNEVTCTTAGNGNGRITDIDIQTTGAPAMCPTDVNQCTADMEAVNNGPSLTSAGLRDLNDAFASVPAALKSSATGVAAARSALQSTVPDSR